MLLAVHCASGVTMILIVMVDAVPRCEIDTQLYEVRRASRPLPIEPQVFDLLMCLVEQRERVVLRSELLELLWPGRIVTDATLSHCIMAARRAVGDTGRGQVVIKTIHRRGYRFVAQVVPSHQVGKSGFPSVNAATRTSECA